MSARLDPAAPVLHLVTDTALSAPCAVPDVVAAAAAARYVRAFGRPLPEGDPS